MPKRASIDSTSDALLGEANRINYRLRSTFFYRKLKEYRSLALPLEVAKLFPLAHLYSWEDRAEWGIGDEAFTYINARATFNLLQVFCHPKVLREFPRLCSYYRNIAILSQKSVSYLARVDVKRYENDVTNATTLSDVQARTLARLFNEHISLIIDSSIQSFATEELQGLLLTSTGAQIDGSWRNAIGEEAENVVQRLLIDEAVKRSLLTALIHRSGTGADVYAPETLQEQLGALDRYRGVMLRNTTSILFSSEPDITLVGRGGMTTGVIEVKGGADPAGALERYGAAKKSFDEQRRITPAVTTILIASCITPEVLARIDADPLINRYFNLTALLTESEDNERLKELMDLIFLLLDGTAPSTY